MDKTQKKQVIEYLEMYHSEGISTVPMVHGEKIPRVKWKRYQSKLPTWEELNDEEWFGKFDRNIAIVCGHISDLVVLDFDSAESYNLCITKELEEKFLLAVTHGERRHVYIRTTGDIESSKDLPLNFEVKSNGAYVVAPPSLHPSGSKYVFQMDFNKVKEYFETQYFDGDEIKELIEGFKVKLRDYYAKKEPEKPDEDAEETAIPKGYPCFEGVFKCGAKKGERDEAGIRLASFLKKRKVKRDSIHDHLLNWNEKNYELVNGEKVPCPLTGKEVLEKIKSADKGYNYSCEKLRELECFAKYCDEDACRLKKRADMKGFKETILNLTDNVVIHPGKTAYYDVHLGDKIYTKSYKEIIKPITFSEWYMANFNVCFIRISKANWESIVNTWMNNAEISDEENICDDDLVIDNIIEKLREFKFMDTVGDCLKGDNVFQCNGGVLVYNNIIKEMLNRECKKFNMRISLRELANLMKNHLNGVSTIRKVGLHSYRFWQFKPNLFDKEDDKSNL